MFEDLPQAFRDKGDWPLILREYMNEHYGQCFVMKCPARCRRSFGVLEVRAEYMEDNTKTLVFLETDAGQMLELSARDLAWTPCRMTVDCLRGAGPEHCPHCNEQMKLDNCVIDALEHCRRRREQCVEIVGSPGPFVLVEVPAPRWYRRQGMLCAFCSAAAPTKKCSACLGAKYCSRACQRNDWANHKDVCRLCCSSGFVPSS